MSQSIFVVHYKIVISNNSVDGVTTIYSDPTGNATEAGLTVARSIQATAPGASVEILATKEISEDNYKKLMDIIKPTP